MELFVCVVEDSTNMPHLAMLRNVADKCPHIMEDKVIRYSMDGGSHYSRLRSQMFSTCDFDELIDLNTKGGFVS